jgi:predicted nuclease of predicted toxin-antitoxin system
VRVLLDSCLPVPLRHHIAGHEVETAAFRGWSGLDNGELIQAASDAGFDVLVTVDQGFPFQQNLKGHSLAVVMLSGVGGTRLEDLEAQVPRLLNVIPQAVAGTVTRL